MEQEKYVDGYRKLAGAITVQAITDFRKALKHLAKGKGNLELDIHEINEVVQFVNSKWFTTLTNVHPEIVLKKLKEEVEQSGIDKRLISDEYNNILSQFDGEEVAV